VGLALPCRAGIQRECGAKVPAVLYAFWRKLAGDRLRIRWARGGGPSALDRLPAIVRDSEASDLDRLAALFHGIKPYPY